MSRFSGSITSTTTRNALFKIGLAIRDNIKHVGTIVSFSQLRKYNKTLPVLELSPDRISCVMFGSVFTARNSLPVTLLCCFRRRELGQRLLICFLIISASFVFCAQELCCAEKQYFLTLTPDYRRAVDCHWMKKKNLPLCIKLQKRCENRSPDIYT